MQEYKDFFRNKNVLITGGLGFIGSNLAIRLVEFGANVVLADAMIEGYGGNPFNIKPIEKRVAVEYCDVRDEKAMNGLVKGKDYIFHLAKQVCHVMSLSNPYPDIDINIKGTTVLMEACKKYNPGARVIYTGTRGQYGPAVKLPVSEDAPTNPKGIYEISNLAAEKIIKVYNDIHGIKSVLLRLTNIYGPRSQMRHSRFGVANWFVRKAIDNDTIEVFGDGNILRDFLYVDDCVEALIMSALSSEAPGEIFNVGLDKPTSFKELAESIVAVAKSGSWKFAPFTSERKALDPGDYYSDITKIRKVIHWEPQTDLREGLHKTIEYYSKYKEYYW